MRCVLDCNAKTLPESIAGARYVIGKPNDRELCALLSHPRTQDAGTLAQYAREVKSADTLLISMGGEGGLLVSGQRVLAARVPDEKIVSTVGSGDASLAGAVSAMARGMTMEETLRLSMACGVANAMLGEVGSIRMQDVQAVREKIQVQKR